jgi:hypothetical protein
MSQTKVEAPFVEGGGGTNFKNLIINGDFQIAQRSTSAVTAGNGTYTTVDRWKTFTGNLGGAYTTQQKTNSLADNATTGQQRYLEIKCTSTDSSVDSNAYAMVRQHVEASPYLQSKLRYGTSDAQKLTLSFWFKSNLTGTHSMSWYYNGSTDGGTTYYYPFNFTVSSANTWEKKIITIPAPPTSYGSINVGSYAATGGLLNINLQIGANYQDPAGSWTGNVAYASEDVPNFFTSTDNNILITAIQLEVGDDASDFEYIPFDVQLQRCQRYYEKSYNYSVAPGTSSTYEGTHLAELLADGTTTRIKILDSRFSVRKRAAPTMTFYTSDGGASGEINNYSSGADKTISSIGNTSETSIGRYFSMTDAGAADEQYEFQYEANAEL